MTPAITLKVAAKVVLEHDEYEIEPKKRFRSPSSSLLHMLRSVRAHTHACSYSTELSTDFNLGHQLRQDGVWLERARLPGGFQQ